MNEVAIVADAVAAMGAARARGECVGGDARVLLGRFSEAIPFYREAGDADSLARLLRLALAFGNLRTVTLLREEGIAPSPSAYTRFLRERALPAVPIGGDVDAGFFVDESIAADIARELGEPLPRLLAETARSMMAGGSRHLAKLFVFAKLARDDELLELLQPALDARARRPRASLDALVRETADRDGGRVVETLQQGDGDDYNPKSAAVWIVEVREREIWKEHLRLAIDYSRVDGYSEEREQMESADHEGLARLRGVVDLPPHELLRIEVAPGAPLPEDAPLPRREAIAICAQIAAALEHLHTRAIAYLDVKPKNVLWDGHRATLVDLGAARRLSPAATVATLPGSPECVTPEIARDFRAGREADLYQLGLLAARLLTGRHPFAGPGISALGDRSRAEALLRAGLPALYMDPDLGDLRRGDALRAIVLALLERDPAARPRASEARAELEALA